MQDLFSELLNKRLVMVTGKGGIGKTLSSFALAQMASAMGKRVCLVESSAHDQLAPLFGSQPIGHNLRELRPGIYVINLNPQDNFRDFVIKHLGFATLFQKVFTRPIVRSFIQMMPGIAELTLLGRLFYFSELDVEDRFDLVILDGFASGHFHSLMKTPDAVLHSGMMGPVIDETQRVRAFIADPEKTAVVLVTVAEDLVVSEALDFVDKLQAETPAPLTAVMLNRTFPPLPDQLNAADYPEVLRPGVEYWRDRVTSEQAAIDRLREGLTQFSTKFGRNLPLYRLPEVGAFTEPVPKDELLTWMQAAVRV
ncbi:ArsA family ATPase [Oligoflexus tunisiensis]|uniref:ArsA family ATPase n=1 Tax=Oligoflexus tunisiensis TaxID=708132 RepID=UPI00114CCFD4|nr:ArsA-related P-loop ATPase [Oligoflexus tunisiensis]